MRTFGNLAFAVTMTVAGIPTAQAANDALYFCDTFGINRAELDGSGLSLILDNVGGCRMSRVDVDVSEGKIYWNFGCTIDQSGGVGRTNLQTGASETLARDFIVPVYSGVVFDPSDRKVYWTRGDEVVPNSGLVERSAVEPIMVEEVVSQAGTLLGGVDVDPFARKVYWTVREPGGMGTSKIRRADLDGQNVEDLIAGLDEPHDLALDLIGRKVYWTDFGAGKIWRANLVDGQNRENVVSGQSAPVGIDVDWDAGKMYWAEAGAGKVHRANLDGSTIETVLSGLVEPTGVRVVSSNPTDVGNLQTGGLEVKALSSRDRQGFTFVVGVPHEGRLLLDLYTVAGRRLSRVTDEYSPSGIHLVPWDGSTGNGGRAPSGVYFYHAKLAPGESKSGRLLLLR